jgi:hypothetical protein
MKEKQNQLLLAAALAGVATVHLGGAGAGEQLRRAAEAANSGISPGEAWRRILFDRPDPEDDADAGG